VLSLGLLDRCQLGTRLVVLKYRLISLHHHHGPALDRRLPLHRWRILDTLGLLDHLIEARVRAWSTKLVNKLTLARYIIGLKRSELDRLRAGLLALAL
jgi:hypothetical protein